MPDRDFEQEARTEGWVPKEEWKGNPDDWKPAQEFVETGDKIAGILKKRLGSLEQRLEAAEKANKRFGEYHKSQVAKERKKAEQTVAELKAQLAEAVSKGDGQEFTRLSNDIEQLQSAANMPPPDETEWIQMTEAWVAQNQWYVENQKLASFADGASDRIRAEGYTGQAYFSELTRRTKEAFPDEFRNKKRESDGVEAPGTKKGNSSPGKKTFNDLPSDAKAACKQFVKEGFMTEKEYVESYEWDED